MIIRRETVSDVEPIAGVTEAAFAERPGGEVWLVGALREDAGWIPELSLVAELGGEVVGHVVCTRGRVDAVPALGLGPLSVRPDVQGRGVGKALMHAVLGAAEALGEPLVALLGDPAYYSRFGFRVAEEVGIGAPQAEWGQYFQVRTLHSYTPELRGTFHYAEPFNRL
ncbi:MULTISPECIES: GNAT family N-acetyltransferase [unclassified Saccharothrix]|uniref:GNAT family N-acetyltransferase n=1 Tax=unclassified Saccharothrix TaxID=2593673 RepID=UPI00307E9C98